MTADNRLRQLAREKLVEIGEGIDLRDITHEKFSLLEERIEQALLSFGREVLEEAMDLCEEREGTYPDSFDALRAGLAEEAGKEERKK